MELDSLETITERQKNISNFLLSRAAIESQYESSLTESDRARRERQCAEFSNKLLGKEVFDHGGSFEVLAKQWLEDEVFSIRQAATDNIKKLTEIFGEEWSRQNIIPKVMELNSHSSYLCRMQVSVVLCLVVI